MTSFNWNIISNVKESFSDEKESDYNDIEEKKEKKCIACNSTNLLKFNNEKIVCDDCGAVNENILNSGKEWRYFGNDDNVNKSDPNRCGMPLNSLLGQSSLSVAIIGKNCFKLKKMNNWNGMTYKERKNIKILEKIKKLALKNRIPEKIIKQALVIFNKNNIGKIKRGKKLECILGSCLRLAIKYYADDDKTVNRSMDEISKLFNIKEKKLSKEFNELFENMHKNDRKFIKKIKPTKPEDLIFRFCSLLNINKFYIDICIKTIIKANELGICQDNNPKSIAVGCIYLICSTFSDINISKKKISKICETSEVTILLIYHQLNSFKEYIIPNF